METISSQKSFSSLKNNSSYVLLTILIFFSCHLGYSQNYGCQRTATINGQKIAIDGSSTQKGENLRAYMEKDSLALESFDRYAEGNKPNWTRIGFSTAGVVFMIAGSLSSNDTDNDLFKRDTLLGLGAGLFGLSFIFAKTRQSENEKFLREAVDQYNRRNSPKIILSPHYSPQNTGWGLNLSTEY